MDTEKGVFIKKVVDAVDQALTARMERKPIYGETLRLTVCVKSDSVTVAMKMTGRPVTKIFPLRRTDEPITDTDWERLLNYPWRKAGHARIFTALRENNNAGLSQDQVAKLLGRDHFGLNAEYSAFNAEIRSAGMPFRLLADDGEASRIFKVAPYKGKNRA